MKKKIENLDWLKESYYCPICKESIACARADYIPLDNDMWIKKVYEFYEKHKEHGVTL